MPHAIGRIWMLCESENPIMFRIIADRYIALSIPPRAGLSPELYSHYLDVTNVRPSRERSVLAAFRGSTWGTGTIKRYKTMCDRDAHSAERRLYPDGPALKTLWGTNGQYDYMGVLGDTIFCPQPAGIAGTNDSSFSRIAPFTKPVHVQVGRSECTTPYMLGASPLSSGRRPITHSGMYWTGANFPFE